MNQPSVPGNPCDDADGAELALGKQNLYNRTRPRARPKPRRYMLFWKHYRYYNNKQESIERHLHCWTNRGGKRAAGGLGGFPDCGQEAHLHTTTPPTHKRVKDVGTSSHLVVSPHREWWLGWCVWRLWFVISDAKQLIEVEDTFPERSLESRDVVAAE